MTQAPIPQHKTPVNVGKYLTFLVEKAMKIINIHYFLLQIGTNLKNNVQLCQRSGDMGTVAFCHSECALRRYFCEANWNIYLKLKKYSNTLRNQDLEICSLDITSNTPNDE